MENQLLTDIEKSEIDKFISMVHKLHLKKFVSKYKAYEECKNFMFNYKMSNEEYQQYVKKIAELLAI